MHTAPSVARGGYTLAGFASLRSGAPAFLIPYFGLKGTRDVFVQELEQDFSIKGFRRFNPEHYHKLSFRLPSVRRTVGEMGVLAYVDESDNIAYGSPEMLRNMLRTTLAATSSAVFFSYEAGLFLQDESRIADAVGRISDKIDDERVRNAWLRLESATLRAGMQRIAMAQTRTRKNEKVPSPPQGDRRD